MALEITFDYRFDSSGFFDDAARRAALEEAGDIWGSLINDTFATVPAGISFTLDDPSSDGTTRTVTLDEPITGLTIFVGAEALGGPLAVGGYSGTSASGDVFRARVSGDFRGTGPVTNFEPWAGTISFDPTKNWSFDIDGPVAGASDFISTALHEIGHVLGIGTAPIYDQIAAGGVFDGPNALAVTSGAGIPLEGNLSHVQDGYDGNQVLMDPTTTTGTRKLPSTYDLAMLADIGYEITGYTAQGSTPALTTSGNDQTVFGTIIGDLINGLGGADQIQGDEGDDTLIGGSGADTLFGQSGDDSLEGGSEADQMQGGKGSDILRGQAGVDLMFGQSGDDLMAGGSGDDDLYGGAGIDTMIGGAGNDSLRGGADTDEFRIQMGGGLARLIDFELGTELIRLYASGFADVGAVLAAVEKPFSNVSRLTMANGTQLDIFHSSQSGTPLTAANFELFEYADPEAPPSVNLQGDAGNNVLTGSIFEDTLDGAGGNDALSGLDGIDTLFGGAGDDTLDGGTGGDYLNGGPGSDRIIVDDVADRVAESRSWAGHDIVVSSVDFRMGRKHIEDLELTDTAITGAGNGLQNRITGNDQDNILDGGKNVDTLVGGEGDDRYLIRSPGDTAIEQAGQGNDVVLAFRSYALEAHIEQLFMQTVRTKDGDPTEFNGIGNGLDNTIIGTPFDNTIVGREGRDTLKGQAGADTFVFDRAIGPDNVDRIIDFNVNTANEGDMLKLKGAEFGGMAAGILLASAFAAGSAAADANDRFVFDQPTGRLWFDADGTGAGAQVLIATFEQNALVTAADIEIF